MAELTKPDPAAATTRALVPLSPEENAFRKESVAMGHGGGQFINPISSVKHMTAAELETVSDSHVKLLVESFLHMVAGSDNVVTASAKLYCEFMPENVFFGRFLRVLAEQIVKPLKMSRWGAGLRLLGMLLLQVRRAERSEASWAANDEDRRMRRTTADAQRRRTKQLL